MRILGAAQALDHPPPPVSLALGVFDGVHRGHAAVLSETRALARRLGGVPVAVTFDRHPSAVLAPDRSPPMIYPLWRRLQAIADLGIDTALVYAFDLEFSRQPAERFVERLVSGFERVVSLCVGKGFVFGHRRGGDLDLLIRLGRDRGFEARGLDPETLDGEVVSSTRVRDRIAAGDFSGAGALLGRPYTLSGEVQAGDQLGRRLGFPTANLDVTGLVLPPAGVYAALARARAVVHPAAVNIGTRPTVDRQPGVVRVEAHLLDFDGTLYGERLELEFLGRLRGEQRFPSVDALQAQIRRDLAGVRALIPVSPSASRRPGPGASA